MRAVLRPLHLLHVTLAIAPHLGHVERLPWGRRRLCERGSGHRPWAGGGHACRGVRKMMRGCDVRSEPTVAGRELGTREALTTELGLRA